MESEQQSAPEAPPIEQEVAEPTSNGFASDDLITQLREKRRQIVRPKHINLDIPGYDGLLVARYGMPPDAWDMSKRIAEKVERSKNPKKELFGMMDTLIEGIETMMIKRGDKLMPVHEAYPDLGDDPIGYDANLARLLGFQAGKARDVVMTVFGGNEMAILVQYNQYAQWMGQNRSDEDEDF